MKIWVEDIVGFDQDQFILITRTVLTIILLFLITWYFEVSEAVWSLTTCTVVTFGMHTIGGFHAKAYLRFKGTLLSALYAILIVYTCGNNPIIDILALIPIAYLYGYYLETSEAYIGILGLGTLTFVLLNYNDVENALIRLFNVMIGIVGSLVMMRFFYPQYARDKIIITLSDFINMISNVLEMYLDNTISLDELKTEYDRFENVLLSKRSSFLREMGEAKKETTKTPRFMDHVSFIKTKIRHLHHLLSILVLYITTNEARCDPCIVQHIEQLLSSLYGIKCKMSTDGPLTWPILGILIKKHLVKISSGEKYREIHNIIEKMESEIIELDKDVEQLILNHQVYKPKKEISRERRWG